MAYANSQNPERRLATISAVALIHVAAGYALITGLTYVFTPPIEPPITATFTPNPPDQPPPPPPTAKPSDHVLIDPLPQPSPSPLPLDPGPMPSFTSGPVDAGTGTGGGIGEALFPTSTPSPSPSFPARAARPKGDTGRWVTPDDYPTQDLRLEHQGITSIQAIIGADGRVKRCEIVGSSGFPSLDRTACDKFTSRARFEPASDETGAKVEGRYRGSVRWQIPE